MATRAALPDADRAAIAARMTGTAQRGGELLAGGARFERAPGLVARLIAPGFHKLLDRLDAGLVRGSITGHLPDGTTRVLGGHTAGFDAVVHLHDWRGLMRLATNGSVGWYQAWAAGEWETPDLVTVFAVFNANALTLGDAGRAKGTFRLAARFGHWLNRNTPAGSARNIHAHYDLGNDFYAAWLDETMTYSSGRWDVWSGPNPYQQMGDRLAYGQVGKMVTIQTRIDVKPGDRVLEIGCGWGAAAAVIGARGVDVDAISLSERQLEWARTTLPEATSGTVTYRRCDYRAVEGTYDAVYSIEMVEALGRENWPHFLDVVARSMRSGGRAAIQFISIAEPIFDAYAASADFIQAYVFPGGLLIRTAEFRALAEARGLRWEHQHDFGPHYAETLQLWRANFARAVEEDRLPDGFDSHFQRFWDYYLAYCEGGFRGGGIDVHQVTLIKE